MAAKQSPVLEVILTVVVFFLTYSTITVASASLNQTAIDEWFKSFSTDPTHPWYQQKLVPEPHRGFYLYGKNCLDSIGDKKCVQQLFNGFFDESKVDNNCLCKLKKMGILCTMTIAGTTGHMEKYKNDATHIYERANKIKVRWDKQRCPT